MFLYILLAEQHAEIISMTFRDPFFKWQSNLSLHNRSYACFEQCIHTIHQLLEQKNLFTMSYSQKTLAMFVEVVTTLCGTDNNMAQLPHIVSFFITFLPQQFCNEVFKSAN